MALDSCPECGEDISEDAESCPHCGHELADDGGAEPSPRPGWRAVGWALLFVLAIPAAIVFQLTRDTGEEQGDTFGPDYACTQFIKSRMPKPSKVDVEIESSGERDTSRYEVEGRVGTADTARVPFTCVTTRREDGAWKLVELDIDSTSIR